MISSYDAKKGESYKKGVVQLKRLEEGKGKASEAEVSGPGMHAEMVVHTMAAIQEKLHAKESSKVGEARAIMFPKPTPQVQPVAQPAYMEVPMKKKCPDKPIKRRLEAGFNEPESDFEELFKEGFGNYDVAHQRSDWDRKNRLKIEEANKRRLISSAGLPAPGPEPSRAEREAVKLKRSGFQKFFFRRRGARPVHRRWPHLDK